MNPTSPVVDAQVVGLPWFVSQVAKFHTLAGQGAGSESDIQAGYRNLQEELDEAGEALDILITALAAPTETSWTLAANWVKELQDVIYTACGLALRCQVESSLPVDYISLSADFTAFWNRKFYPEVMAQRRSEVLKQHRVLFNWCITQLTVNPASVSTALGYILACAFSVQRNLALNPYYLFRLVSDNNLSKVSGVVTKDANGKVVKPVGYMKVNLVMPLKQAWRGCL